MSKSRMDNKRFSSMFRVGRAIGQVIAGVAWTVIQWDTQTYDELEEVAIIAPYTFVPALAGLYSFYASVRMDGLLLNEQMGLSLNLNAGFGMNYRLKEAHRLNEQLSLNVACIQWVNPTDFVDVRVQHTLAGNRTIAGSIIETLWYGYRIG